MSIYKEFCKETVDENGVLLDFELDYPDSFNFGYDVVDKIAEREPDKTALVWCNAHNEEKIFTFAQMKKYSDKAANVFKNSGLKKGDRVLVILKRHYEYWFTAVALHKLGVTMIPATHMLTEDDMAYRLKKSDAKACVCTFENDVPAKIKKASEGIEREIILWTVREDIEGFKNLTREMESSSEKFERIATKASDPMLIYFTSGTTGNPKGVIHDFSYPLAHIVTAKYWQCAKDGGLHFTVAETGWAKASWGKIYGQWLVGSGVMVYDFDNFEPKNLVGIINKYKVTSFCAPPTVFRYLVRKGCQKMPSLCHASTAGEMLSPEVFKKFTSLTGIPLAEGYGQTETTLLMANFKGREAKEGSIGVISPFYNIELLTFEGKPAKDYEIGEICVVPPKGKKKQTGIFTGYLDNDKQYEYVWRNGVYHTGDAAYRDENGRFWFKSRFDDIIKTGGYRVGPYEIEHVLQEHPAVLECSVVGVPDPLRGQAIKAVVRLIKNLAPSKQLEKEIKDFCNSKLAEYKWIRFIEFADILPKTISGKIIKRQL